MGINAAFLVPTKKLLLELIVRNSLRRLRTWCHGWRPSSDLCTWVPCEGGGEETRSTSVHSAVHDKDGKPILSVALACALVHFFPHLGTFPMFSVAFSVAKDILELFFRWLKWLICPLV